MSRTRSLLLSVAVFLLSSPSYGGLGRPNHFAALGLGIGGAGYAGVPNPSTIHYNPAGLVLMPRTELMLGGELVTAPRSYAPLESNVEEAQGGWTPAPVLGISTRFARPGGKRPLPIAVGLAFYNTFGGSLAYDEEAVQPGITEQSNLLLELVPAVAYEVNSRLAVGIALRLGFGLFAITNTERSGGGGEAITAPAKVSGSGINVGVKIGLTYKPMDWLQLGLVYASPMKVEMQGDGEVEIQDNNWRPDNVTLTVPWPQWAAFGIAAAPVPSFRLYAGLRWTDWSAFQELVLDLHVITDKIVPLDYSDGFSAHLGFEMDLHQRIVLRGGASFDSNTSPDATINRMTFDANKVSLALGGSFSLWRSLILDVTYELLLYPERDVPDVTRLETDPITNEEITIHINDSPGRYRSQIHTIAFGLRYSY